MGDGIYYSNDGLTWSDTGHKNGRFSAIAFGNGRYVAFGSSLSNGSSGAVVSSSSDGIEWRKEEYQVPDSLKSSGCCNDYQIKDLNLVYGNGRFVMTTSNSLLAYSSNGSHWTSVLSGGSDSTYYCCGKTPSPYNFGNPSPIAFGMPGRGGFDVSSPSANTVETGTTAIFTVSLDKSPTSSVVLSIKSDNPEESSISPQTLTFTPENWNSTQTVTVTGVDDELKDGNQDYHVILGPAQSDDPLNGSVPKPVMMVNVDDENTLEPLYISIGEGFRLHQIWRFGKPVSLIMEVWSNQN